MDEADFNALADAELACLEGLLDKRDLDFDYELKPGGIVELSLKTAPRSSSIATRRRGRSGWRQSLAAFTSGRKAGAGWGRGRGGFLRGAVPLHDGTGRRAGQPGGLTGRGLLAAAAAAVGGGAAAGAGLRRRGR